MTALPSKTAAYFAKVKPRALRFADAFPLRLTFFLFVILAIAGYGYISTNQLVNTDTSLFAAIIRLMLKLLLVFILLVTAFSFISTVLPFALFSHRARTISGFLTASFNVPSDGSYTTASMQVQQLTFPLFGSVKLRFYYEGNNRTQAYSFASHGLNAFFANKADLQCTLNIQDIRSYRIDSVRVSFTDLFRLFSFSHTYKLNSQFYTLPQKQEIEADSPAPVLAKENNIRTEVIRKVEGEHLYFKDFEPSDDIRRIIWKIYAKHKELVVRIPEVRNPFASEVGFAVSYYNSMLNATNGREAAEFLNAYKQLVWSFYDELNSSKDVRLKLLLDQHIKVKEDDNVCREQLLIGAAGWQTSTPASELFKPESYSILFISALTAKDEVSRLIAKLEPAHIVVFCRLSGTFDVKKEVLSYVRMLFMKPKDGSTDRKSVV